MLSRTYKSFAIAVTVGAFAGALAAVSTSTAAPAVARTAAPVSAAPHCTRYNPSTAVDVFCGENATSTDAAACTSSTALRDFNLISLPGSWVSQWVLLYFTGGCFGSNYSPSGKTGSGSGGSMGGQGGYTYSACEYSAQTGLFGRCTTDWHN